jgi:proteic killer suppression protein
MTGSRRSGGLRRWGDGAALDFCKRIAYRYVVIKSFVSKPLAALWQDGRSAKIDARLYRRILMRLDRLDAVTAADEMNIPGFNFHRLNGLPVRYTVHVNGPWCITFAFEDGDAVWVDFEQYH